MLDIRPEKMFNRIRTTKGYGVHSPFAFSFITEVLTGDDNFYAMEEIEHILAGHGVSSRHNLKLARLLFRIIIYVKCADVRILGDNMKWLGDVVNLALVNLGSEEAVKKMLIVSGFSPDGSFNMAEEIGNHYVTMVDMKTVPSAVTHNVENIIKDFNCGMVFRARKDYIVYVADPTLPFTEYKFYS